MALALFATALPALVCPASAYRAVVAPSLARSTPPRALAVPESGSLADTYKQRWGRHRPASRSTQQAAKLDAAGVFATALGGIAGTSLAASVGAFKSVALTDASVRALSEAWAKDAGDITTFTGAMSQFVADTNERFLGLFAAGDVLPNLLFFFVMLVDAAAFCTLLSLGYLYARDARDDALVGWRAEGETELCLIQEEDYFCGPASFDSTEEYACIETVGRDGKLTWVCA